jgi:hypothetical protein
MSNPTKLATIGGAGKSCKKNKLGFLLHVVAKGMINL